MVRPKHVSIQKLLDLQRRPGHCLGGRTHTRRDDQGQGERAALPIGLLWLLHRLGVDDDCPIRLSAAKAMAIELAPGIMASTYTR